MNRTEFDAHIDSVLLYAERLIPKETLPDLPYVELAPTLDSYGRCADCAKRMTRE